jgi:cell division protein FtsI/penicillin-binding protein 2
MHGAMIAAAIENHGIMMSPTIIDEITDSAGNAIYRVTPRPWLVTMSAANADTLARLSENTTREGSASRVFANRKGWRPNVRTGGKTGTLSNKKPFYTFNWYIGWGEDARGRLAVGALVVNTEKWWIKGTHVAARAMGTYFKG